MNRITGKKFINIIKTMSNKSVKVQVQGAIGISQILNNVQYSMQNGIVVLRDKATRNYVVIDLNEAYCTMGNEEKTKVQANIDSLNNDTVITLEKIHTKSARKITTLDFLI